MTILTQAQRGLVERLRDADISGHGTYSALVREAADVIKRLTAECEEWRGCAEYARDEIERMTAENKRLRVERDELFDTNGELAITIGADALRLRKENEQLRARVKQLHGILDRESNWPGKEA